MSMIHPVSTRTLPDVTHRRPAQRQHHGGMECMHGRRGLTRSTTRHHTHKHRDRERASTQRRPRRRVLSVERKRSRKGIHDYSIYFAELALAFNRRTRVLETDEKERGEETPPNSRSRFVATRRGGFTLNSILENTEADRSRENRISSPKAAGDRRPARCCPSCALSLL